MDPLDMIEAELSKMNFLIENLYAVVLKREGFGADDVDAISDEYCRQYELPGSTYGAGGVDEDQARAMTEYGTNRIAMHFAQVQDLLKQVK